MKKSRFILLLLVLGLIHSGCSRDFLDKIQERFQGKKTVEAPAPIPVPTPVIPQSLPALPETQASSQPASQPASQPSVPNDFSQTEEVNSYIQCLNRTSERVNDSLNRYLSWVNEKSGPNCSERYISYGLYTLYSDGIETCQKAAQKGTPGSAMQKNAADLAAAYAELVPLVQKAEDYYSQEDYKDDACVKGKQMHPVLLTAFRRYTQAQTNLENAVDSVKGELDRKELARLEQEQGRKLAWYSKSYLVNAEKLMRSFPKDGKAPLNNAQYLTDYSDVEKTYEALSQYITANPQEGKDAFWFSSFEGSAKEFYTKAKFLKRDLADGKKPAPNTYNDVIRAYNRLVQDSNNLRFR